MCLAQGHLGGVKRLHINRLHFQLCFLTFTWLGYAMNSKSLGLFFSCIIISVWKSSWWVSLSPKLHTFIIRNILPNIPKSSQIRVFTAQKQYLWLFLLTVWSKHLTKQWAALKLQWEEFHHLAGQERPWNAERDVCFCMSAAVWRRRGRGDPLQVFVTTRNNG